MASEKFGVDPAGRPLRETEFSAWLARARSGDCLEYHRGLLAIDASVDSRESAAGTQRELNRVARRAWWAAQHGRVHLVQVRHGVGDYTYLAIARGSGGGGSRKTAMFAADAVEPPS